jgi:hypothetical protein
MNPSVLAVSIERKKFTGTLTGSGTLSIPKGVFKIYQTGAGGSGTSTTVPAYYTQTTTSVLSHYNPYPAYYSSAAFWVSIGAPASYANLFIGNPGTPVYVNQTTNVYNAPVTTNALGVATTSALGGVTKTWAGGSSGAGNVGTTNSQPHTISNGVASTLTYSAAGSGGSIAYTYYR